MVNEAIPDRWHDGELDQEVFEERCQTLRSRLVSIGQEFIGNLFRLGARGVVLFPMGLFLRSEVSLMPTFEHLAFPDAMGTGFLIRTIDDAPEEIVIGPDPRRVIRFKAGKNGEERDRARLFDPLGDTGNFELSHEDKRPEHARGRALGTSLYRRIEAIEEFPGRIEVKMGQDHELRRPGLQGFPELTILTGCEKIGL